MLNTRDDLALMRYILATQTDFTASPSLLQRARLIAAEHKQLSQQNAEDYDLSVARRIGEIKTVAEVVKEWDDAHNVTIFF
jgi:peptide chain release factor 1